MPKRRIERDMSAFIIMSEGKRYPLFESNGKIFCVDFDGTLCVHSFPKEGAPNTEFIKMLIQHRKDGGQIILWTCRSGEDLQRAIDWSRGQGLEFDAVNSDVQEIKDSEYGKVKSIKPYADRYFDDRAVKVVAGDDDEVTSLLKTYLQ